VHVQYSYSKGSEWGNPPSKEVTTTLDVGEHRIELEFDSDGSFGYWSPALVGGKAEIGLYYLVSQQQMLDEMNADSSIDKQYLAQFLEDWTSIRRIGKGPQADKTSDHRTLTEEIAFQLMKTRCNQFEQNRSGLQEIPI
jgi:hypothetical protein